jgi:hypothetical protein
MSDIILSAIVRFAKEVTRAERGMSVDVDSSILDFIGLTNDTIETPVFWDAAASSLTRAMKTNQPVLTNNIITDPAQAPITNTTFTDLRVIVAIPVDGVGAIYLDQHIRNGMFQRDTIDKICQTIALMLVQNDPANTPEALHAIYDSLG